MLLLLLLLLLKSYPHLPFNLHNKIFPVYFLTFKTVTLFFSIKRRWRLPWRQLKLQSNKSRFSNIPRGYVTQFASLTNKIQVLFCAKQKLFLFDPLYCVVPFFFFLFFPRGLNHVTHFLCGSALFHKMLSTMVFIQSNTVSSMNYIWKR